MVDWYYIFSILPLGVYPSPQAIYNVVQIIHKYIYSDFGLVMARYMVWVGPR
jgi:hypothetical protein